MEVRYKVSDSIQKDRVGLHFYRLFKKKFVCVLIKCHDVIILSYNLNVIRQSACLVINPITVDNFAALFNCTPGDRSSDSMMAPT